MFSRSDNRSYLESFKRNSQSLLARTGSGPSNIFSTRSAPSFTRRLNATRPSSFNRTFGSVQERTSQNNQIHSCLSETRAKPNSNWTHKNTPSFTHSLNASEPSSLNRTFRSVRKKVDKEKPKQSRLPEDSEGINSGLTDFFLDKSISSGLTASRPLKGTFTTVRKKVDTESPLRNYLSRELEDLYRHRFPSSMCDNPDPKIKSMCKNKELLKCYDHCDSAYSLGDRSIGRKEGAFKKHAKELSLHAGIHAVAHHFGGAIGAGLPLLFHSTELSDGVVRDDNIFLETINMPSNISCTKRCEKQHLDSGQNCFLNDIRRGTTDFYPPLSMSAIPENSFCSVLNPVEGVNTCMKMPSDLLLSPGSFLSERAKNCCP